MAGEPLDDAAYLVALATLPKVGPARLRALSDAWTPRGAWQRVCEGLAFGHPLVAARAGNDPRGLSALWQVAARQVDPAALWASHAAASIQVLHRGTPTYPALLAEDLEPPELLYAKGDVRAMAGVHVGLVGTRRCSRYGHDVARRLGAELSEAGVSVVSGLAAGIDGAAHEGALEVNAGNGAPPIGVVGSGLDVVYPPRHRGLWQRVADRGVLVSEAPLGTRPEPWRFPARNRIIAALSKVLVVVESAATGGSLLTVSEAQDRGLQVMAVPGPVTSPASVGTNQLIADGAQPVLTVEDIFEAIGVVATSGSATSLTDEATTLTPNEAEVLDALGATARTLEELVSGVGLPFDTLAVILAQLTAAGWVTRVGGYYERARWT